MILRPALADAVGVTLRTFCAVVGGFAVTSLFGIAVADVLAVSGLMEGVAAVSLMTMLSWLIWALLAMWSFHAPHAGRLLAAMAVIGALCGACALAIGPLHMPVHEK